MCILPAEILEGSSYIQTPTLAKYNLEDGAGSKGKKKKP